MSGFDGEASASSANQIPSIGLAVVDSTAQRRIKAFACHAQAFPRWVPRFAVTADGSSGLGRLTARAQSRMI